MDDRLVEQIVRQVMAQFGASTPNGAAAADPPTAARAVSPNSDPLVLDEPVVTAETLAQRVDGHRHVAIGRRTVLTPSALDYFKAEGIDWTRGTSVRVQGHPAGTTWAAIVSRSTPAVERLFSNTESSNGQWRCELVGAAEEAAQRAVSCICRGEACGSVVFAECPEAVACRANRNASVRAAVAADASSVTAAVRSIGANLICVASDGKSYFEMRNILRAFTAAGPPQAPAGWSES